MTLEEYKQHIKNLIKKQEIPWTLNDEDKPKLEKELADKKQKQLNMLKDNLVQGTLHFYSDRHPVLIKIGEKNGKVVCEWVREYESEAENYYGGEWKINFDKLRPAKWMNGDKEESWYTLVWNKWIKEFSNSSRKNWEDRGYDFQPLVLERYEDPSF